MTLKELLARFVIDPSTFLSLFQRRQASLAIGRLVALKAWTAELSHVTVLIMNPATLGNNDKIVCSESLPHASPCPDRCWIPLPTPYDCFVIGMFSC